MPGSPNPSSFAAAISVIADAFRTTFGLAVIVVCFLGITLIIVAAGMSEPPSAARLGLVCGLVFALLAILGLIIALRVFKPIGLSGPLEPQSNDLDFEDPSISPH